MEFGKSLPFGCQALIAVVVLLLAWAWPANLWLKVQAMKTSFRTAEGLITVSSKWSERHLKGDGYEEEPKVDIRYKYKVGEKEYENDAIAPRVRYKGWRWADRFPEKSRCTVYYDPENPQDSYLVLAVVREAVPSWPLCVLVVGTIGVPFVLLKSLRIDELMLNPREKTWTRRKGVRWSPKTELGSFSDLEGLRFAQVTRSRKDTTETVYLAYVVWRHGQEYKVEELGTNEVKARAKLEDLSRRLGLPITSGVAEHRVLRRPDELDVTLKERAKKQRMEGAEGPAFPEPPADLSIEYSIEGDEARFVLPPNMSRSQRRLCVIAFAAGGALVWGLMAWATGGGILWGVLGAFMGFCLSGAVVLHGSLREYVTASPSSLDWDAKGLLPLGAPQSIPCREIEEITFDGKAIVVRSDKQVIRIAGTAPSADIQWLADVLRAFVSG